MYDTSHKDEMIKGQDSSIPHIITFIYFWSVHTSLLNIIKKIKKYYILFIRFCSFIHSYRYRLKHSHTNLRNTPNTQNTKKPNNKKWVSRFQKT